MPCVRADNFNWLTQERENKILICTNKFTITHFNRNTRRTASCASLLKKNQGAIHLLRTHKFQDFRPTHPPPLYTHILWRHYDSNTLAYAWRLTPLPPFGAYIINEWPPTWNSFDSETVDTAVVVISLYLLIFTMWLCGQPDAFSPTNNNNLWTSLYQHEKHASVTSGNITRRSKCTGLIACIIQVSRYDDVIIIIVDCAVLRVDRRWMKTRTGWYNYLQSTHTLAECKTYS